MIIRSLIVMLEVGGGCLWFSTKIMPIMALLGMDYVGIFMMIVPVFIVLSQLSRTRTTLQFDPPAGAQNVVNYIRRDGNIIPLIGIRIFSGESFLSVKGLGLLEDLGKDTVFNWGVRRTRLGLENISYTPDPRYWNFTSELYRLGFDNNEDLYYVLNVSSIKDAEMKTYYLEYMGRVYLNLLNPPPRGAKRLVKELKEKKPQKHIVFGPRGIKKQTTVLYHDDIALKEQMIDDVIYKEKKE